MGQPGTHVLLLENIHPFAVESLERSGCIVETVPHALTEDELTEAIAGVGLLGIRSQTKVTAKVLANADRLLAVGAFCIGTNQIDLPAASRSGVAVFNAPYSNTRSVVELAIGEIIALTRQLTDTSSAMHRGVWDKRAKGRHEVRGRTLGIVGYGNIGSQLSVVAEAIGMRVVFFDTADKLALGNAVAAPTLGDLLDVADVVSLHVDGRAGNGGLFGADEFARMRPGALFLNLSRGFVVDHEALAANLDSGHLGGAAVDVFPQEPAGRTDDFRTVLAGRPNVILTPHVGGSTEEAQADIGRFVAGKLADYLNLGTTTLSVNLPRVALDLTPATHRVAHLHRNVPGVLAAINRTLAEGGVNIEGQLLATSGDYGYVLTDVGARYADEVAVSLGTMPETIRVRVLS